MTAHSVDSFLLLRVFAAASLTEAFTEIAKNFEQANPGTTMRLNFAGSNTLATQIIRGAPADVFASSDRAQMQRVTGANQAAAAPTVFVQNKLQIVVPKGNPGNVQSLAAFGKPELDIAVCAKQVPCGAAAQQAFEAAGVTPTPDTLTSRRC
ncbi:MAG: molybdate ABC transporter substrate-binding protein [Pseudonocardiaceae bacterium]